MIILLGKSCSGKNTIQRELCKLGFSQIVSYTSRPPRSNEKNGMIYKFISEKEFFELYQQGFFVEKTSYKVDGGDVWHYGTALSDIKENAVMIGRPKNVKKLKNSHLMYPFVVYIDTNEDVIYEKFIRYHGNIGEAQRRIVQERKEFSGMENFIDYRIENNGFIEFGELAKVIKDAYDAYVSFCRLKDKIGDI